MTRISALNPAETIGKTAELLAGVQKQLGITPNLMKTLAHSTAGLEAYLNFNGSLAHGKLNPKLRELIAVAVAQENSCQYCLSAHTTIGGMVGLTPEQTNDARDFASADAKTAAGLHFAKAVLQQRGQIADAELASVRAAGFSDAEVVEIIAHVSLNIFTNYFNNVAATEVDFPLVSLEREAVTVA